MSKSDKEIEETSDFQAYLQRIFDVETQELVSKVFESLQLPEPVTHKEFMAGCEGALLFLNASAMTLKIEPVKSDCEGQRIPHPSVLQPIFKSTTGRAIVEIYPGVDIEGITEGEVHQFTRDLLDNGIQFLDACIRNTGTLPEVPGVSFPDAEAYVVIDRLSVKTLATAHALKGKLQQNFFEDPTQENTAQFQLYKPLYDAFSTAYHHETQSANADKMQAAWALCEDFKANGKTVTSWMSSEKNTCRNHPLKGRGIDRLGVQDVSLLYGKRLYKNKLSS